MAGGMESWYRLETTICDFSLGWIVETSAPVRQMPRDKFWYNGDIVR